MSKTKLERIADINEEITQLKNRQKQLQQQHNAKERKARNHRLCKRGGFWESLLPDSVTLTDEQFKLFLVKTLLTDYARNILRDIKEQNTETSNLAAKENTATTGFAPGGKPTVTGNTNNIDGGDNASNNARHTG